MDIEILVPLIRTLIIGPAGTVISCFLQTFYVSFLFPLMMKRLENKKVKTNKKMSAA
ncbi:MAG: hypothetical protein K5648_05035 [Erysipelotrichaceae bacterium]|nr:hypothetical protein [Erysipelotrichaceae bacterium]